MDLWEIGEYIGEALVFVGVVGEVFAGWTEPERKKLEKVSSIVLVIGLAVSIAALIGTNENFNGTIAKLYAQAAGFNEKAGEAERDAAEARQESAHLIKDTQALRLEADNARLSLAEAQLALARLTGPAYLVPVIHGVATPDLSVGFTQRILLTAEDTVMNSEARILQQRFNGATEEWAKEDVVRGLHRRQRNPAGEHVSQQKMKRLAAEAIDCQRKMKVSTEV